VTTGPREREVRATLLGSSWYIPALPVAIAGLAFLAEGTDGRVSALGIGLLLFGVLIAVGVLVSRVELTGDRLSARFYAPWRSEVALDRLVSVRSRRSKASLGTAPALDLLDRDGRRLALRLGWWTKEPELLAAIDAAAAEGGAAVEPAAAAILAERPDGRSWEPGRRRRAERDRLGRGAGRGDGRTAGRSARGRDGR
jgi:hypothetical protein